MVVNGLTKVFRIVVTPNDVKPFFELFLPEKNVLGVTSVILKDGTQYSTVPSPQEFLGLDNRWYEVPALVEDRVFIEDPTKVSDQPGIKVGKYINTNTKFITEYTPEGFMKLTFGGGNVSADEQLKDFAVNEGFDRILTLSFNELKNFMQYTKFYDAVRNEEIYNVFPELNTIIFEVEKLQHIEDFKNVKIQMETEFNKIKTNLDVSNSELTEMINTNEKLIADLNIKNLELSNLTKEKSVLITELTFHVEELKAIKRTRLI